MKASRHPFKDRLFYGFQPLRAEDFSFAWSTPAKDCGGCMVYEMRRQLIARKVAAANGSARATKLKDTWLTHYSTPWVLLSIAAKRGWNNFSSKEFALPLKALPTDQGSRGPRPFPPGPAAYDPAPGLPGALFVAKVDFDLTDAELVRGWTRALKQIRPRDPIRRRKEEPRDVLAAIAAQRIFDHKGPIPLMRFADDVGSQIFADGRLPFANERRFTEACLRYQRQEAEFDVDWDGDVRLHVTS